MRLERFNEAAQAAFQDAQEIMREQHHTILDVEHIFLAMLRQPQSVARHMLESLHVDVRKLQQQLERALAQAPRAIGQRAADNHVYITPRTQRLIGRAEACAAMLKDPHIGIPHLLVAISEEQEGASAQMLHSSGITPGQLINLRST